MDVLHHLLLKMQIIYSLLFFSFCFIGNKATHTHTQTVHVTQNSEFNNWSNLIQCNWLKLRNFINIQWKICSDDIETSELIGLLLCRRFTQRQRAFVRVLHSTIQRHWQTTFSLYGVICNWIFINRNQWNVEPIVFFSFRGYWCCYCNVLIAEMQELKSKSVDFFDCWCGRKTAFDFVILKIGQRWKLNEGKKGFIWKLHNFVDFFLRANFDYNRNKFVSKNRTMPPISKPTKPNRIQRNKN